MGLGWGDLALQHHLLYPTGYHKVYDTLCSEREGLGSSH